MTAFTRLAALRRQSGNPAPDPEPAGDDRARVLAGLGRRLRRGSASADARRTQAAPARDDDALARDLNGEILAPGVIRLTGCLAPGARQGEQVLSEGPLRDALSLLGGGDPAPAPRAIVFMDTETTGLAGGTGTLVFLLGLARFSTRGLEICQLLLTGFHGESALLALAARYMDGCGMLVSFNGSSFDAPLLATRYRLAGLEDPFSGRAHVDLLHATRRAFARHWPDCRLQTAEQRLLGHHRVDDLPGAQAPLAWFDWVRDGRSDRLPRACAHNRDDLVSLAALALVLARSHRDPLHADADVYACARFLRRCGDAERAYRYLLESRARLDGRASHELARLAGRRGEWPVAVQVWEALAWDGDLPALEALAKYHEHRARDLPRALELTRALIEGAPADHRHRHRQTRLLARLSRMTPD